MSKHYHFLGIGGIGMSGIAHLFLKKGYRISGCDVKETKIIHDLRASGVEVFIGHSPEHLTGVDVAVYSSAINPSNPEMEAAVRKGIPMVKRAQALAELMQDQVAITVAGSHGKTTTTSLVSYLLIQAGLSPTAAIGGILKNIGQQSYRGGGRFFVAEADESDGSFLYYRPRYSIITNIDCEHLDYYRNFENAIQAFREFIDKTALDGCVFYCDDDTPLKGIMRDYRGRAISFGLTAQATIHADNIVIQGLHSAFDCYYEKKHVATFSLALGGRHNISNALSVIALGLELGIETKYMQQALSTYEGAGRRIEVKYCDDRYCFIDDYAHHPTEIRATLQALRHLGKRRVVAVFQPHRYSRTRLLLEEFGKCFDGADYIIVTDIYPASEQPLEGVTGEAVCEKIVQFAQKKQVKYLPKEQLVDQILRVIQPDDLVVTLGAGDIYKINEELVERVRR